MKTLRLAFVLIIQLLILSSCSEEKMIDCEPIREEYRRELFVAGSNQAARDAIRDKFSFNYPECF